jgi:PelA/Pel-15E family pectate lyase
MKYSTHLTRREIVACSAAGALSLLTGVRSARAGDATLVDQALASLNRAAAFFRSISTHGGYLWSYSTDLSDRRGEGKATASQIWVQPPGTPAVGEAYLRAYQVTNDVKFLESARLAAEALAYGQLESGGWHYSIDFDPQADRHLRRAVAAALSEQQKAKRRKVTTFDDDTTQSCVRFLMALVQTTGESKDPRDPRIRDTLDYALAGMLRAQYPNGAWPQAFMGKPHDPTQHPNKRASFPADWRQLPQPKEYWFHYTLNDHSHTRCAATLLEAHRRFGGTKYLDAVQRAGDFLIQAQLPDPQPAWAQQYTFDMVPAWARKFEPPSVCSSESAGAVRTLVDIYLATSDEKYLAPIPAAVEWFKRSRLPDGRWSRFYELKTNKPLYFTKQYELTFDDSDLPTHYSFQDQYGVAGAIKYHEDVKSAGREKWLAAKTPKPLTPDQARRRALQIEDRVRSVVTALDDKGRWLSKEGRIESKLFIQNVETLCDYLEVARASRP